MLQELTTKTNLAQVGEEIGLDLGKQMVKSYSQKNASDVKSYLIGREIIEKILAQPGCVGLKLYNAFNEEGEKTLVYVGVDDSGSSIIEYTAVNIDGKIEIKKGIVADRVRTEGGDDWDIWKWLFS
jgi:hypothetical protein